MEAPEVVATDEIIGVVVRKLVPPPETPVAVVRIRTSPDEEVRLVFPGRTLVKEAPLRHEVTARGILTTHDGHPAMVDPIVAVC